MHMSLFKRNMLGPVLDSLAERPVVLVNGPRQVGKTVLARSIAHDAHPSPYHTLDDALTLGLVAESPQSWLEAQTRPIVIDEVQRVPDLLRAIKLAVDARREPGGFLLTGSADVLALPRVSESLAGRMDILTLWPLSQGEMRGVEEGFVDALFSPGPLTLSDVATPRETLVDSVLRGCFPEPVLASSDRSRSRWTDSFITTVLEKDVRDMAGIVGLSAMPRVLTALASRACTQLNLSEMSRTLAIPWSTLERYVALLTATFLVRFLPAWSGSVTKQLARSPKVLVTDSGLLAHLLRADRDTAVAQPEMFGRLLEDFAVMEVIKQMGWSETRATPFHFRTQRGDEVDLVLEGPGGSIVGIEIKSASSLSPHDFKGLRVLAEVAGERFRRGVVLYAGEKAVHVGGEVYALPMGSLWSLGARPQPEGIALMRV
jgi:predicted AAA+ superfamily ATPase